MRRRIQAESVEDGRHHVDLAANGVAVIAEGFLHAGANQQQRDAEAEALQRAAASLAAFYQSLNKGY
jgi:hypothetical protein